MLALFTAIKLRKPNEKPTLTGKSGRHGISAAAGADKSRGIEGVDPAQVIIYLIYINETSLSRIQTRMCTVGPVCIIGKD